MKTPWYSLLFRCFRGACRGAHQQANYKLGQMSSRSCPRTSNGQCCSWCPSSAARIPRIHSLSCYWPWFSRGPQNFLKRKFRSLWLEPGSDTTLLSTHACNWKSVKNTFEPHLNAGVAQIFLPLPTAFKMGKSTTKQSLKKFALNEFLLE